ncbi:chromate efflux transporter [Halomonas sp. V046]|uniref:chromate efflux transporter n=1 Tax=Halomonas sp. V046 TaxID=3459611 RepID=UPI004044DF7A
MPASSRSSLSEIFRTFLGLGLTSFGGPAAHLGYFRSAFVERRGWLSERAYADLVVLCQFLPGPASSQVGLAIGLIRGGLPGALAAWLAFTLPSALLLIAFALGASALEGPLGQALMQGLKLVAVVIVAHAVQGMARTLCPDRRRAAIAVGAIALVATLGGVAGQVATILAGALAGAVLCRNAATCDSASRADSLSSSVSRMLSGLFLALFVAGLVGLPLLRQLDAGLWLAVIDAFYRAGALVFGGGHVVLPLLQAEVVAPGWVSEDAFLSGYGAAQAVPGPLFTLAAYLGMVAGDGNVLIALLALVAVFLPGALLVLGLLPMWDRLRQRTGLTAMMAGANAAVVGLLAAALFDPIWLSTVTSLGDFTLVVAGFVALARWGWSPLAVVLACLGVSLARHWLGGGL